MNQNYLFFFGSNSPFSNWYPVEYTHNGITFNCSEQGVMYEKAILFNDHDIANKILQCSNTEQKKMKALGRKVKNFKNNVWNQNKQNIYKVHITEKFKQNHDIKSIMMATQNKIFVEASPYDSIWGIGMSESNAKKLDPSEWKGSNLLGKILTEIKNEFKK